MSTAPRLKGIDIPATKPLTTCARCAAPRPRGKAASAGWTPVIDSAGTTRGTVCPGCPAYGEPIRRVTTTKGDVRWRFTVTVTPRGEKQAVQKSGTADTLAQARERVAAIRAEVRSTGTFERPATVADLAARWLDRREQDVKAGVIRPVTHAGYRSSIGAAVRLIGARRIEELTEGDVDRMLATLATKGGAWGRPLSSSSLRYTLLSVRQMLKFAVKSKWLPENVAADCRLPKTATAKRTVQPWDAPTLDAFREFVDAKYADSAARAAEPWVQAGMRLTLTGMRRSEVLGLDWSAVDLDTGTVKVRASRASTGEGNHTALGPPKTRESARAISVETVFEGSTRALRELWMAQGRPESGLVILDSLGRPVGPDVYSRKFRSLCREAGLPDLGSIHNVRHTISVILHDAGMDARKSSAFLGHGLPVHLAFYVTLTAEGAAEAGAALGQVLRGKRASGEV